ncbi:hypothetical protein ABZW11_25200 [Nonomuraea sp. NPDC004580]|uniref:hypothetical protein n=1 Tax=Nonomuraea sp. NPDC004580 TaxID=3154552 RepID=UPI0033B73003
MKTYSYTSTRSRTEAVVDQFDLFLRYTGLRDASRVKVLDAVEKKWLDKVGVYLVDYNQKRILEVSLSINWELHAQFAAISPRVSTDLPGWDSGAAPEIRVLGHRFGKKAREHGQTPHYWVLFVPAIRSDVHLHRRRCDETGVSFSGTLPEWRNPPVRQEDRSVLDLEELGISVTEA